MLFEISAETRGGLRVIPTIPNISRCWLEGRNGIGKTVAARLLELIAGKQPYSTDPDGWAALKENLGQTIVTTSEFPSKATIESIRVELTPDQWPSHPAPLTTDLGSVFIDGHPSDHKVLRNYFDVSRIGGDETVVAQLRALIGADHTLVNRCRAWLEDAARDAERVLTPLIIDLDKLSELEFESAHNAVQEARGRLAESESELESVARLQLSLQELIELLELQQQQLELGPSLQAALDDCASHVRDLTEQKNDLTDQLRDLVPKHAASQELQRELEELLDLRDGRLTRAARTHSRAQQALQAVELDEETLTGAQRDAIKLRHKLRKERSALDALPVVLDIIEATRAPLVEVEASSLDDEIVAVLEGSQRVATSVLRSGLNARAEELRLDSAFGALTEIDQQIKDNETHIRRLMAVRAKVKDADRKASLLASVEDQIQQKTQQLRASTGNEYASIADHLQDIEVKLTDAIRREVEYKVHLDLLNRSGGVETLEKKIDELQQELGVPSDETRLELRNTIDRHRRLTAQHQQYRMALAEHERTYLDLEDQLGRAVHLMARGSDYQWLQDCIPAGNLPTVRTDRHAAIRQLTQIAAAGRSAQSAIEMSLNQVATIQGALDGITQSIAMHRDPLTNPFVDNLIEWYEGQMSEFLSNEDIREGIFEGGEFQRFDLMNGLVAWRTNAGESRRRPIEAFSSGERAFAYMLAAVLSHRESTAQYRVFILDEFGAFVEQRRRSRLWRFLDERILKTGIATQVVVILPSQSRSPVDEKAMRFDAEGYFATEAHL